LATDVVFNATSGNPMKQLIIISAAVAALISGAESSAAGADVPAAAPVTSSARADLKLTFKGLKVPRGALMVAIYDSEAAYTNGGQPVRVLKLDVAADTVSAVVPGLVPGRYGIKLFHDLNGDAKLTMNMFGIPTEPVAFSNNAKINMRAPNWAEASFDVPASGATQTIDID
jgi:uncharacterized protein (DUF2141 family)